VADHWPAGYILEDMWDFTHTDYWDSQFGKGYPWHFDNPLPSADSHNPKPLNLIAFSIFKVCLCTFVRV
jgi:GH35 family endo-1,4-beta-xylanase